MTIFISFGVNLCFDLILS